MTEDAPDDQSTLETVVSTEAPPAARPETSTRSKTLPPFNVIILNDEVHTVEYVVELLGKLFHHDHKTSVDLTMRIHYKGRAVVYTTHKEKAELKCEQVLAYGPDPRMAVSKTSLGCYIEPAAGE